MCRLTPDELDACREQAARADRMELCVDCGTPYDGGPVDWAWDPVLLPCPTFRDGRCFRCRPT